MRRTCSLLGRSEQGTRVRGLLDDDTVECRVELRVEEGKLLLFFVPVQLGRQHVEDLRCGTAFALLDDQGKLDVAVQTTGTRPLVLRHLLPWLAGLRFGDTRTILTHLVGRATGARVDGDVDGGDIGSTLVRPVVRAGSGIDAGILPNEHSAVGGAAAASVVGLVAVAGVAARVAGTEVEHQEGHRGHSQKSTGHVHGRLRLRLLVEPKARCPQQVFKDIFLGNAGAVYV